MIIASNQLISTVTVVNYAANTVRQLPTPDARRCKSDLIALREALAHCLREIETQERRLTILNHIAPVPAMSVDCAN
jgi:hypothetical protein